MKLAISQTLRISVALVALPVAFHQIGVITLFVLALFVIADE